MRLFVSHSSRDEELVRQLVELFVRALALRSKDVRCSSLNGYRLAGGAKVDEAIREEVLEAELVVGVLTASSLRSQYVLFELGARWSTGRPLIPIAARGITGEQLRGPLAALHTLSCDDVAQVHQLVEDVADALRVNREPTAAYCRRAEKLSRLSRKAEVVADEVDDPVPGADAVLALLASDLVDEDGELEVDEIRRRFGWGQQDLSYRLRKLAEAGLTRKVSNSDAHVAISDKGMERLIARE